MLHSQYVVSFWEPAMCVIHFIFHLFFIYLFAQVKPNIPWENSKRQQLEQDSKSQ